MREREGGVQPVPWHSMWKEALIALSIQDSIIKCKDVGDNVVEAVDIVQEFVSKVYKQWY